MVQSNNTNAELDAVSPKFRYVSHQRIRNGEYFRYEIESFNVGDGIVENNGKMTQLIIYKNR